MSLSGIFTNDLFLIIFPLLTILLCSFSQILTFSHKRIVGEVSFISEENRIFREKIEAHRDSNTQSQPIVTSKRTSQLIKKLKRIKSKFSEVKSFTEGSDNDSLESDIDLDAQSRKSLPKEDTESGNNSSSLGSSVLDGQANQGITNDDIKEIINNLISQEYLSWNPDKCKDENLDIMAIASDTKSIYTQSIESLPGSSSRIIKIPKLKLKRIQSIRSMTEVSESLGEVLETLGEWDFDCFELIKLTKDPAFEVGLYVFNVLGLSDRFKIDNQILRNFLTAVEQGYNRLNLYHNSLHAADVTASTLFLTQKGLSRCGNLVDLDVFALVTSAICHDIGHPGVNNSFLVSTSNELAIKYNDNSCLENMHANKSFTILNNDNCNILKFLNKADYQRFRKNMVSAILATDLQLHFDKLNEFRNNLEKKININDDKFRLMAIQMCLKCADIGHGARKLFIHKQ